MEPVQFDVIAKLIRARDPSKSAARRHLVDGITQADAAREFGLVPQSVYSTVKRFNIADELILEAYSVKQESVWHQCLNVYTVLH